MSSTDVATTSAGTASMGGRGRRVVNACREEFTLVVENGKAKMQCNHCRLTITNHTATLRNHLARKHSSDVKVDAAPRDPKTAALATLVASATAAPTPAPKPTPVNNNSNLAPAMRNAIAVAVAATVPLSRENEHSSPDRHDPSNGPDDGDDIAAIRKEPKKRAPSDRDAAVATEALVPANGASSESKRRRVSDHDAQTNGDASDTSSSDTEVVVLALPLIDHDEFAEMNRGTPLHCVCDGVTLAIVASCLALTGTYTRLCVCRLRDARARREARADHQAVARDPQVEVRCCVPSLGHSCMRT